MKYISKFTRMKAKSVIKIKPIELLVVLIMYYGQIIIFNQKISVS